MRNTILTIAALSALGFASAAQATVFQSVGVRLDNGLSQVEDTDAITDPADPITDTISAAIVGGFGNASGSVGAFGELGVQARQFQVGQLATAVFISNDFVPNASGIGRRAELRFIIDGGFLSMFSGPGSTLDFDLSLSGFIFDRNDNFVDFISWSTGVTITSLVNDSDIQFRGEDIGATAASSFVVDIPLSFQTVDIGVIPSLGYADFSYNLSISTDIMTFVELAQWGFSDPLSVSQFPRLVFVDDVAVPAPPSLPLMALGILPVLWRRRRSGRRPLAEA